ncbi:MAG: hypothetical protein H0S77_10150 [Spirochaetaceae bacterium]|jgi:archaellum component FlaC|nr:hypothetical protein [Spirochaetaceae bacterium]
MVPEVTWKEEFERLNRKIDRLSATNEKLVLQGIKQSSQLFELTDQNKTQSQIIDKLSCTIDELKQVIASRDARIAQLEEQKHSSKPASINKGEPSSTKKKTRS